MRLLTFDNLTLGYPTLRWTWHGPLYLPSRQWRAVIRDASLTVDAGQVVLLKGRNGCGKTTCLRAAAGLLSPMRGTVEVAGSEQTHRPARRYGSDVVLVSDKTSSYYRVLSVAQNLRIWALMCGIPGRLACGKIAEVMEQFQLDDVAGQALMSLSSGQLQRSLLAIAMLADPAVLLLDEPWRSVDDSMRALLAGQACAWARSGVRAVVIADPRSGPFDALVDETYEVVDGRIVLEARAGRKGTYAVPHAAREESPVP